MSFLRRSIRKHIVSFIRVYLRNAQIVFKEETRSSGSITRFTARIRIRTSQSGNRGEAVATGIFRYLSRIWPFDRLIRVPKGGFKPVQAKALRLEKPEGIVFRSRTYTKFGGQTIRRKGFVHEARRQSFNRRGTGGQTPIEHFLDRFSRGIVRAMIAHFARAARRAGVRVQIIR